MIKAVLLTVLFSTQAALAGSEAFPKSPNPELTPGDVCHQASSYRYPERIPYCDREVDVEQKVEVIKVYDSVLNYRIYSLPRKKFKIDHYIPLCMGGSNESKNLWPQHESVFKVTDPLEQKLCAKMAEGKMLQAEAIDLIKRAKNDLTAARAILEKVNSL